MNKLKPVVDRTGLVVGYQFQCPGCPEHHYVPTVGDKAWGFNGDLKRPTFTPSILVYPSGYLEDGQRRETPRCHSFVRDGRIQFLSDCGHMLAGQTVDLLDTDERIEEQG